MGTGTASGNPFYKVSNLEDNDYYASEEAEEHVRSIVTNGYWGTAAGDDAENPAIGSLAKLKKDLKAALANGDVDKEYDITFVIRDKKYTADYELKEGEYVGDGYVCRQVTEHIVLTDELIDAMTEGEAMDATQMAIWSYANGSNAALDGTDREIVGDVTYGSCKSGDSLNGQNDYAGAARTKALYNWLINLQTEDSSTTVINEKNFVEDMILSVGDKAEGFEANNDNDKDNDVYNANFGFKLAFVPGSQDDLLIYLTYPDANGNPVNVVRRLAGTNAEGENYEGIKPDANGNYIIEGLKLSENETFDFNLRLEGTQYLEQGVYIYTAQLGTNGSQTMVGLAEGTNTFDISKKISVKFDVDEDNQVVVERTWHDEADPEVAPNPGVFAFAVHRPLENIPEEEVPLADAPQTGDEAIVFAALTLLAGISLMAMHVSEQKRKEEV